ncbi:MAG: hypothetical protein M3P32_03955 [Chloroflexota bacterium]|nr:hypothetical protein [Chloroflexota bacterium]
MSRSHPSRRIAGALALITGIALAGCATGSPSPSTTVSSASAVASASALPSSPASQAASAEPSATVTATAVPSEDSLPPFACVPSVTIASTTDRAQITDVRVGTHAGYDRVTFEFASGIPQTVVKGVLPPFYADPSGLPLDVSGTAFLEVTMNGGTKVTDGVITYAGPTNFEPGYDQLLQLREGGDWEALSTWYLGFDGGGCYRVLTLAGPSRLVIDIEH